MTKSYLPIACALLFIGCGDSYMECSSSANTSVMKSIVEKQNIVGLDDQKALFVELKDVATLDVNEGTKNRECRGILYVRKDDIEAQAPITYRVLKLDKSDSSHYVEITSMVNFNELIMQINAKLKEKKLLSDAKKAGFDNIKKYSRFLEIQKELKALSSEIYEIEKLQAENDIFKNSNIYTEENDFIEISSFKYNHNNYGMVEFVVKNKSKYPITYFLNNYYFYDEELDLKSSFSKYNENILLRAGESKKISFNKETDGTYFFSRETLRVFAQNKNLNLYVVPESIYYKDEFGENKKIFKKNRLSILNKISLKKIDEIEVKLKRLKKELDSIKEDGKKGSI